MVFKATDNIASPESAIKVQETVSSGLLPVLNLPRRLPCECNR
jgi:hypothetical protein